MQDGKIFRHGAHHLQLHGAALHVRKAPFQQHLPVVQNAHMVADVLQLPEVVGGNQNADTPLGNVGKNQAQHLPPHHRVQTVQRLVEDQHIRPGAHSQLESGLLLHALGKPADGAFPGKLEGVKQPVKEGAVKFGVGAAVVGTHVLHGGGGEVENVVGYVADTAFDPGVFVDPLAFHEHGAAVRPVHAGEAADQSGFSRPVGTHKTINGALGDMHGQIVQGFEGAEGFCQIFCVKHTGPPVQA